MAIPLPRGTLINTGAVLLGGFVGVLIGNRLPVELKELVMAAVGIVNLGIGFKMMFGSKNIIIVVGAAVLGVMIGFALGIQRGFDHFAVWVQQAIGSHDSHFVEVLVGASILYCVGPMTLLGCIQDGLERKIDLLAIKSVLDGFMAIFFAATSPAGIFVTAVVVLVLQSVLTFAAAPLRPLSKDSELMAELDASGGILLVAIGLGLTGIKKLPVADYLPALIVAPLLVLAVRFASRLRKGFKPAP